MNRDHRTPTPPYRVPPGQNPQPPTTPSHRLNLENVKRAAAGMTGPQAQPIQPDPHLMPEPDMGPAPKQPAGVPELDEFPPMSYFGIAPDLNISFNLDTYNHILRILFPLDPFTRGILYAQTMELLNRYLQNKERL